MKGILFKTGGDYLLKDIDGKTLAITNGVTEGKKLSKQNCDEIFGVVDVEMVACKEIKIHIDQYNIIHTKATEKNASPCTPSNEVEIEMECPQCQEWGYVSECRKDCNKKFLQPKLNENNCLILKVI